MIELDENSDEIGREGHIDLTRLPQGQVHHLMPVSIAVDDDTVCVVQDDATMDNYGRVSVGDGADAGDTCEVTITMGAIGYNDKAAPAVELTVVSGQLQFADAPVMVFDGELKVGMISGAYDDDTPANFLDVSGMPEGFDHDGDGAEASPTDELPIVWHYSSDNCYVMKDGSDAQKVTVAVPGDAVAGSNCVISAVGHVAGYEEYEAASLSIRLAPGDLVFADDSANKVLFGGPLREGAPVAPGHEGHHIDDNHVKVTWGSWRVVGYAMGTNRGDDTDDEAKADVCSIDGDGMVSLGSGAAPGDFCEVYAVASAANYNDSEELGVGLVAASNPILFGALTAPEYNSELALRGLPIEVAQEPAVASGEQGEDADVTWTYTAAGYSVGADPNDDSDDEAKEDVCSIDEMNGTVTPGSAIVQGDYCNVTATASAPGYLSKAAEVVTLTVNDTFIGLTWATFPSTAAVGTTIDLSSNQPVSDPVASNYVITAAGDCAYNAQSKMLSFTDATECVVTVTAQKAGLLNYSESFRITPTVGTIAVSGWGSITAM